MSEEKTTTIRDYDFVIRLEGDDIDYCCDEVPEEALRALKKKFKELRASQRQLALDSSLIENAKAKFEQAVKDVSKNAEADPDDVNKAFADLGALAEQEQSVDERIDTVTADISKIVSETISSQLVRCEIDGKALEGYTPRNKAKLPLFEEILSNSSLGGGKQDSTSPRSRR